MVSNLSSKKSLLQKREGKLSTEGITVLGGHVVAGTATPFTTSSVKMLVKRERSFGTEI